MEKGDPCPRCTTPLDEMYTIPVAVQLEDGWHEVVDASPRLAAIYCPACLWLENIEPPEDSVLEVT